MGLDLTPEGLSQEARDADQAVDRHLEGKRRIVRRFTGSFYDGQGAGHEDIDNRVYEYITQVLPQIIWENPKVKVTSASMNPSARIASTALQIGMNQWTRVRRTRNELVHIVNDALLAAGFSTVTRRHNPHFRRRSYGSPQMPELYHMPPERMVYDALADKITTCRFKGHKSLVDRDALLEDAKHDDSWNVDAIQSLSNTSEQRRKERQDQSAPGGTSALENRDEVMYYEIWVDPSETEQIEFGPEDGYNGVIYTVGVNTDREGSTTAAWVREPRDYYGPPWGPYQIHGAYVVPGDPFPLGPVTAAYSRVQRLNQWAETVEDAAMKYKRIVLYPAENKKLGLALKNDNDMVIPVPGLNKNSEPIVIEVGGITEQHVGYQQILNEQADRALGMDDAQRGNVDPDASATAVAVADNAGTIRLSFIKAQIAESIRDGLANVMWYLYHDNGVAFALGEEALTELLKADPLNFNAQSDPWFLGGGFSDGNASFNDLMIDLDIYSMERTNEGLLQRRMIELFNIITQIAQVMPQTPFVNWRKIINDIGLALNMPDANEYIDEQMLAQMVGQQETASEPVAQIRPPAGTSPGQDRFSVVREAASTRAAAVSA